MKAYAIQVALKNKKSYTKNVLWTGSMIELFCTMYKLFIIFSSNEGLESEFALNLLHCMCILYYIGFLSVYTVKYVSILCHK